ncbi:MAG: MBL fold metallo-hydrolase [Bacteroidetes bacterium]|nr:MBL fold metallo-hydrolase [Bacteroidota bacterium]
MTFQSFGGTCEVTGSQHILSVNGKNILLDCGLFQGKRAESLERNSVFQYDPSSINAVILSHAHIDHSGNIPGLVRHGFRGPVYCTSATSDLCRVMLYDSAYLQERDIEYVNKKRVRRGESPLQPLYDVVDVTESLVHFLGINYHYSVSIAPGVHITFYDAGHILGSAMTVFDIEEHGRQYRVCYTGDLGRRGMPILRDPEILSDIDILILESTYGGTIHDPINSMKESLLKVIDRTVQREGKIIIPSFSVGRTQEIVYLLHELCTEGRLPILPIYIDSPLAVNTTEVFRMHPECFDDETLTKLHNHDDPFGFNRIIYVRSVEQSKSLNNLKQSAVIIAASGMCEGGRIVHHLANNIENPNNTILIVGYQAQHTLGRRLVEKAKQVSIFGELYEVNAEVVVLNSFSAHAGQDELLQFVTSLDKQRLKTILLVHGEEEHATMLQTKLFQLGYERVQIPRKGENIEIH